MWLNSVDQELGQGTHKVPAQTGASRLPPVPHSILPNHLFYLPKVQRFRTTKTRTRALEEKHGGLPCSSLSSASEGTKKSLLTPLLTPARSSSVMRRFPLKEGGLPKHNIDIFPSSIIKSRCCCSRPWVVKTVVPTGLSVIRKVSRLRRPTDGTIYTPRIYSHIQPHFT
jgi:hypothetical protein